MSPLFRVILILLFSLVGSIILLYSRRRIDDKYLMVLSFGFPFIDLHFSLGSFYISPFILISIVYVILRWKYFIRFCSTPPILILLGVFIITTLFSKYLTISFFTSIKRLFLLAPIAASYSIFKKNSAYRNLVILVLPPIVYTVVFAAIQLFINPLFTLYYSIWDKDITRLSFLYMDPQVAGCVVASLIILVLNLYLSSKKIYLLLLSIVLFCFGCFTGSKTFLLGTSAAVLAIFLRANFTIKNVLSAFVLVSILYVTYDIWSSFPVYKRMFEFESSLDSRTNLFWIGAYKIFLINPFLGIGPGSFQSYIMDNHIPLMHIVAGKNVYAKQPESGYLLWLDEYGLLSVILIALLVYTLTRKGSTLFNFCNFIPWLICFVSLYNLGSAHVIVLLSIIIGGIYSVQEKSQIYAVKYER